MRHVIYINTLCLYLALALSASAHSAPDNSMPSVVFLSIAAEGDAFGKMQNEATRAAAKNLGIDLTIIYKPQTAEQSPDLLEKILSEKPDYLIFTYQSHTRYLLSLAEKYGVYSVTQSASNPAIERAIGSPRDRYPHWIGSLSSNETGAAQALTERLYRAIKRTDTKPDKNYSLLAFNGLKATSSAILRREGLIRGADQNNIDINRIFEFSWSPDVATKSLQQALAMYPNTELFWAASDVISLSVIEKMKALGKQPNVDFYTAGFDWTEQGLNSIEQGEMLASAGAQFLNTAWILVLLYDHYHQRDFKPYGTQFSINMPIIDTDNITAMRPYLDQKAWKDIDFKAYTQTHNKGFTDYTFNIFETSRPPAQPSK